MSFSPLTTLGILENQNYIINSDFNSFPFASNATFGWSLRNGGTPDATSKLPTSAPTGSPAGTLALAAASGGSQISGTVSARLSSTAATTAGDMLITDALALDAKVRSTVLSFSFSYSVTSNGTGTPNFSGTSANAIGVAIYDVTNAAWIQPAGVFNLVQSLGVGRSTGTFQVPSNCSSVRLAVYFPNSTAASAGSPFTVILDDFVLSPQAIPTGAAISDWASYNATATGLGTGSANVFGKFRRVGDSYEIEGYIQATVAGSGASGVTLSLPGSIDLSKLSNLSNGFATLGVANFFNGATNNYSDQWTVIYDGNINQVRVIKGGTATLLIGSDLTLNSRVVLNFKIPVVGLSSNTVLSQDTDTRVVAARGTFAATSIPSQAVEGSETRIEFATTVFDTHSATTLTGATKFTAPVTGIYKFYGLLVEASANFIGAIILKVYKNGSQYNARSFRTNDLTALSSVFFNELIQLNAGDYVDLRVFQTSGSARNFTAASTWAIERLSGPATIASSETVACRVGNNAAPTLGNIDNVVLPMPITVIDTHSSYSSSTGYTVPVSGKYLVTFQYITQLYATASTLIGRIQLNGTSVNSTTTIVTGVNAQYTVQVTGLMNAFAGNIIRPIAYSNSGAPQLSPSTAECYMSIVRVGN
jgi:hypothetical protein